MRSTLLPCGIALGGIALVAGAPLRAQTAPNAGASNAGVPNADAPRAFVARRGSDTVVVERVERGSDGVIVSRLTFRGGGAPVGLRLVATFVPTADARVRRLTEDVYPPGAIAPAQHATLTFGAAPGDSVEVQQGNTPPHRAAAPAGALPYVNLSMGGLELLVRRARVTGGSVPVFIAPGVPAMAVSVTPLAPDSVVIGLAGVELRARVAPDGQILGLRVPAQGLLVEAADPRVVAALRPPAAPPPSYAAPPGAPYTAEEVRVPTPGGFTLAGTLTLPRDARRPVPVVVTITGSGPQERDERLAGVPGYAPFRQIADTLARRGIGVLRLDDRGTGASGGTFATSTTRDFADDVRAALAWLRARAATRGDVDARRLALLGHSEGGLIAPMVAADDPQVAALVLLAAPAYDGRRILTYQFRAALLGDTTSTRTAPARRDSLVAAADRMRDSVAAASAWGRFFATYDPLPTARRVRVPVLLLQGAADRQVTPEQADTLAAAFRAGGDRDVTVRVFPDTDHLFLLDPTGVPAGYAALPSKEVRPEVLGAMADWLATHLGAAAQH